MATPDVAPTPPAPDPAAAPAPGAAASATPATAPAPDAAAASADPATAPAPGKAPKPVVSPKSTLVLDPTRPLTEGLALAFARVLAYAERWATDPARDPARAVHEYRKSIRRARAVVRLVRPALKEARYRGLDQALRQAVLETSFVRDAEVLGETAGILADLPDLAAPLAALRTVLAAQHAAACVPEHIREVLARSVATVSELPAALARALPAELDDEGAGVRLLRTSFRRVRRCYAAAVAERTDPAVHDWRKRVKELRYQLELLEVPPATTQPREAALGELAKQLGLITDLMVLREAVRHHAAALGPAHAGALVAALDAQIPTRFERVAADAAPFFDVKAGAFARGVLGQARPDDPHGPGGGAHPAPALAGAAAPPAERPAAPERPAPPPAPERPAPQGAAPTGGGAASP